MKPRPLALIAGVVFAVSFLLPSFADANGFECFSACWSLLRQLTDESQNPVFTRIYYSAFVLTNVAFAAVLATGLLSQRLYRVRFFITVAAFFHVVSWFVLNVPKQSVEALKVGYYVWLLAYCLLLASLLVENSRKPAA